MSDHTITLFTDRTRSGPRPTSFAASILFHGLAAAVAWFSIAYKPPIAHVTTEHFAMRELDLHTPDEQKRAAAVRRAYPHPKSGAPANASHGRPSQKAPVLRQVAQTKRGPQTLIQPDLIDPATLAQTIPVPQVLIWKPSPTPIKRIVPPSQPNPVAADVTPSAERPNDEMVVANINLSSSFKPTAKPIIPPSTTSPVAIHTPQPVQAPPVSTSQTTAAPAPSAVLSLSDVRMTDGTAALPPVSESAPSDAQGILAPGQPHDSSQGGKNDPSTKPGDSTAQSPATADSNRGPGPSPDPAAKPSTTANSSSPSRLDGSIFRIAESEPDRQARAARTRPQRSRCPRMAASARLSSAPRLKINFPR